MISGVWEAVGDTGEPNLAEYHLDWWNGFNDFQNDDIYPSTGGLTVHFGGDYRVTSAYLSRGEGAVREIDGQSYNNPPERFDSTFHIYYPREIEWFSMDSNLNNIVLIKTKIMTEGVMGTCMCYNGGFINNDFIHYQPSSSQLEPNHAIAIIGWNDTLVTQAPNPGAWLCKNSWGEAWGNDGYFWISYYDKHAVHHPEMGAISFQEVELYNYKKIYYHDYHGWRATKTTVSEAFNAFTADSQEAIKSISFFTAQDNVDYVAIVYGNFQTELSDTLSLDSGLIEHTGFHTIDISSVVILNPGQEFYVYVKFSNGGHPYDQTSDVPVLLGSSQRVIVESRAEANESYYRSASQWKDLFEIDETANFCIKALTVDPLPTQAATPSGATHFCQNPDNFIYETAGSFNATDYIWELIPSTAGTIFGFGPEATIDWDNLFTGTAEIYVKGINSVGEGNISDPLIVEISAVPQINLGSDTILCLTESVILNAENAGASYVWSNSTGLEISFDQYLTIDSNVFGLGTETFFVTVVDSNGCENSDEITITFELCLGISNSNQNFDFQIFPNINNGIFNINFSGFEGQTQISIFNLYGEIVYQEELLGSKNELLKTINVSFVSNGVYILHITNKQKLFSKKLIISNPF